MNRPAWLLILLASVGLFIGVFIRVLEMPEQKFDARVDPLSAQPEDRKAPHFSLADREGLRFQLSDLEGRFVLLNFWASWCKPCKDELPDLAVLAKEIDGRSVRLVLVSGDEDWSAVDRLAEYFKNAAGDKNRPPAWMDAARLLLGRIRNTSSLINPGGDVARSYGTSKYPETYLIGPQGNILYRFIGPKPWAHPEAVGFIKRVVDAQKPAGVSGPG